MPNSQRIWFWIAMTLLVFAMWLTWDNWKLHHHAAATSGRILCAAPGCAAIGSTYLQNAAGALAGADARPVRAAQEPAATCLHVATSNPMTDGRATCDDATGRFSNGTGHREPRAHYTR